MAWLADRRQDPTPINKLVSQAAEQCAPVAQAMISPLGTCSPDPIAFQLALRNSVAISKFGVHVFPAMRALIRISGAD
jgi:hypothetical protein